MSPSYIIQFIIMNMKSKSNLSVLDIAAGSGGFVFDLLEIKELSFVFLVAVDNGLYEKVYDEDFEEEFNENVLKYKSETNNSSKVILQYFKQDEYRFLEKTYNKYDIINISNFLHFLIGIRFVNTLNFHYLNFNQMEEYLLTWQEPGIQVKGLNIFLTKTILKI